MASLTNSLASASPNTTFATLQKTTDAIRTYIDFCKSKTTDLNKQRLFEISTRIDSLTFQGEFFTAYIRQETSNLPCISFPSINELIEKINSKAITMLGLTESDLLTPLSLL